MAVHPVNPDSVPIPQNQEPTINRYMEIDLHAEISSNSGWGTFYRVAAIASIVAFTAIAVVGTILCAIYAPLYTPLVLLGSILSLKYFFYDTVYKWLDDKADVCDRALDISRGILERLEALENDPTGTQERIREIRGADAPVYTHITDHHYALALARHDYWLGEAVKAGESVNRLRGRATEMNSKNTLLRELLFALNPQAEKVPKGAAEDFFSGKDAGLVDKIMGDLFPDGATEVSLEKIRDLVGGNEKRIDPSLLEAYVVEESKQLPALLKAAFMRYVIQNPTSTHDIEDFGIMNVTEYVNRALRKEAFGEDVFYRTVDHGQPEGIDRQQILGLQASVARLQALIFNEERFQPAAAA